MEKKSKINFEDFKLENVTNPDYVPNIEDTEDLDESNLEQDEVVVPDKTKNDKVKKNQKPLENPTIPEEDEDDLEPEVEPEKAGQIDSPAETEIDLLPFYQLFHEKLGWELDEENMPENSVDGLIEYMNTLVEQSSKPVYATEETEKFDKFVANGGDPRKFFDTMYANKDYSQKSIDDFKSETAKKETLKDYLTRINPDKSSDWIEKKITRYEDSGVLDDEFADAFSELQTMDLSNKQTLLQRQEAERRERIEAEQAQIQELQQTILNKKDIAGIPVKESEMKDFFNFLAVPEKDGTTRYNKVLMKDKEAVIKMAYLAYKGFDVKNLKTAVKSDVVKDLKQALSKYSSSTSGLNSRTGLPAKSNKPDYSDFDLGF